MCHLFVNFEFRCAGSQVQMLIRIIIEILFTAAFVTGLVIMQHSRKLQKKQLRNYVKGLAVAGGSVMLFAVLCYSCRHEVFRVDMPEGPLCWSDVRPADAKLCVPAAYTDANGAILGQYKTGGKTHNSPHPGTGTISLKGSMFYVDYKWLSDQGFQQHTIVLDSVPKKFKDTRYKVRRALCKNGDKVFLLQSHFPMNLSAFARQCAKYATNAVNLDMGHCGYGYYKYRNITVPLAWWAKINEDQQTNWLYVE